MILTLKINFLKIYKNINISIIVTYATCVMNFLLYEPLYLLSMWLNLILFNPDLTNYVLSLKEYRSILNRFFYHQKYQKNVLFTQAL